MNIKKHFRHFTCFLLVAIILFCLAGCDGKAAVVVQNASVSDGVFAYYLDNVLTSPSDYGFDAVPSKKQAIDAAVKLCEEHIAVNSICREKGYKLSNLNKSSVATVTENYWGMFSGYYKSIGMEKQDLTSVKENAEKRALITEKLFGAKGETPVKKFTTIKALNNTHVGFKAITGYFTKIDESGNEVSCTEEEKEQIKQSFSEMAEKINNGEKIESLNRQYNKSQGLTGADKLSVIVIDRDDTTYSKDFYSQVKKLKVGTAGVIELDDYIYVIQRTDISSDSYLELYARDILKYLKSKDVNKIIDDKITSFGKPGKHSLSKIYSRVEQKHQKKEVSQ